MLNETPTQSPTPTPGPDYPPGVTGARVDAANLSAAHQGALANRSVTVRTRWRVVGTDGDVIRNGSTRSTVNGSKQVVRVEASGLQQFGWSYWSNGTTTVVKERFPDGAVERRVLEGDPPERLNPGRTGAPTVANIAAVYDLSPSGTVTRDGETLWVLTANRTRSGTLDRTNISVRLLVTREGMVRSVRTTYETVHGGTPVTVSRRFWVEDVGTATVAKPGWVNETLATAGTESQ